VPCVGYRWNRSRESGCQWCKRFIAAGGAYRPDLSSLTRPEPRMACRWGWCGIAHLGRSRDLTPEMVSAGGTAVDRLDPGPGCHRLGLGLPWLSVRQYIRSVERVMLARLIEPRRLFLTRWNIGVDSLATQLVIGWRLAHGPHRMHGSTAPTSTSCGQLVWSVYCPWAACADDVDKVVADGDPWMHDTCAPRQADTGKREFCAAS
jgi:hypothetical protein